VRLVNSGSFGSGTQFTVPWASLAILVVITYIASLLATAAPAIQASRIRPARRPTCHGLACDVGGA
jgi:ABC-type antimicrobial peptide transport system permease subunit